MRSKFRHANIGVAVGVVFAVLATIFFNGDEDLMEAFGAGAFAIAIGIFLFLNAREERGQTGEHRRSS